jgi:hypothetical protein
MKQHVALLAVVLGVAALPTIAVASDVTSRLTPNQIDAYCSVHANGGNATFTLADGRTVTGSVNCSAAMGTSNRTTAATGTDDKGMEMESATDSDSTHED